MRSFVLMMLLILNCSIAFAYTPKVYVEFNDVESIYNVDILQKLTENLNDKLSSESKFTITSIEEADYIIKGKILGIGTGQLVNNPLGTAYTLSSMGSSLFVSPFAGPILGGIGMMQIRKNVFAIAVEVNIIRSKDNKFIKKNAFLGRTNLKKIKSTSKIVDLTVENATELITKQFNKDIDRKKPKIFIDPANISK